MTGLRRIALGVILIGSLVVGLWAQVFPRSFYDDFPGAGRVWVAVDGPFNEHLVRDVGGLNLGLAFVAGFALVTGSVLVARAAGGAALLFGLPHLLYHATHLDPFATGDVISMLVSLTVAALAGLLALAAPAPAASTGGVDPAGSAPPVPPVGRASTSRPRAVTPGSLRPPRSDGPRPGGGPPDRRRSPGRTKPG